MDRSTFLDRAPLGIPNYLAIALVAVLLVAMVPRGARMALETNTNNAEDWLPDDYPESANLAWFRGQFGNEAFVVVSWDGCTLARTEQLDLLAAKLTNQPLPPAVAETAAVVPSPDHRLFSRIVTGPSMIDRLTGRPARLSRSEAVERLTGVLVGPPAVEGDDLSRTTCLVAYLGPQALANNRSMRATIDHLVRVAREECNLNRGELHLGGPPVDNVAIDVEGERTLRTLALFAGLAGVLLAYACFRNVRLTALVLMVAVLSAGASLALVYYFGAFEVLVLGAQEPRLGKLDAILMSMPAVVYVLSLSGAIHLVNYYRDAVRVGGRHGAVERAVRMALLPCTLAALTTAIGLASLAGSDILPIEKFGVFSAIGIGAAVALLFSLLPVALHRFAPPADVPLASDHHRGLPAWARRAAETICRHHGWTAAGLTVVMVLFAMGLPRIESSVKLLKLLDPEAKLVQDYAWLESHLGHLVPMEVVVSVPPEMRRGVNDHPEASGTHYAMTTFERLMLSRRVADQLETLAPVGRVLDASMFSPSDFETESPSNRRTHDYILSEAIDDHRFQLSEFLRSESTDPYRPPQQARELWRASARVAALDDIDYGRFVEQLRAAVEPVLAAYRQRSELVARLAQQEEQLAGGRICLVVPTDFDSSDVLFAELLREAGVGMVIDGQRGHLRTLTIDTVADLSPEQVEQLAHDDAVVVRDPSVARMLMELADGRFDPIDLSAAADDGQLSAVYTGVIPVVYKTQRELLTSLQESLVTASALIAVVLMALLRSIGGGLASMIPNLFPVVVVFGGLGWLGVEIDIGIMMTASVALGVAVDDTIHFVSWFRRGLSVGLSRYDAALEAYERCATAMVQTTLVAGLGLAVFALSTFTPTQQFGLLMVTILAAALVGDLILLPALLVGPLGRLFPAFAGVPREVGQVLPTPTDTELAHVEPPAASESTPREHRAEHELPPPVERAPKPAVERAAAPSPAVDPSHDDLSPAHAALRNRLRSFRRDAGR